jgi:lysophospholipase L1-like esterase
MRTLCQAGLLVVLIFGCASATHAQGVSDDKPLFMLVLGDSVTKGVWADTALGTSNPDAYRQLARTQIQAGLLELLTGRRVNDISNSQKYALIIDHYFDFISRTELSALIGHQPYSIPTLVRQVMQRPVEVFSATMLAGCFQNSDLLFDKIEDFYRAHNDHADPNLVFVNFNAMDFVFKSTIEDFGSNVKRTFEKLAKRFPKTTIVVSPLVDIVTMMTTSYDMVAIPAHFGMPALRCADTYQKIGFDTAVGVSATTSAEDILKKNVTLLAMQQLLDDEIGAIRDHVTSAAYEQFVGQVIRVDPMSPPGGRWSPYLAMDCIHPNIQGQALIGQNIWRALEENYF